MSAGDTMWVDNRAPLETEVIRKKDFLERREAAGPGELHSPSFNYDGEVFTRDLTKLLGLINCFGLCYRDGGRTSWSKQSPWS